MKSAKKLFPLAALYRFVKRPEWRLLLWLMVILALLAATFTDIYIIVTDTISYFRE